VASQLGERCGPQSSSAPVVRGPKTAVSVDRSSRHDGFPAPLELSAQAKLRIHIGHYGVNAVLQFMHIPRGGLQFCSLIQANLRIMSAKCAQSKVRSEK
jgi:hypothetical protein